ncbi:proline--tRNA ligase [Rhabdochlamydiaceae symbiont of Dictyostelium giganteum]|uniref:proline--tRNA ligase n=1 Tax=Rhabdochlamydiaceae symbiont of Dictyostelium giganteum TaxID=3342349 RepID=UPI00384BD5BE
MNMKSKSAITPTRAQNYPEWYQEVIKAADLAEHSPVRGCMVIKPWGYALWENMQKVLDKQFKKLGVQNAYFPLFIPLSFLQKEAEHVEGFAKECAVVTHHKLTKNAEGKLVPSGELEEPLIVRPTSEMIIGEMFSKWVTSYRDLPLKINQWANVVRWEMRTRLFLRTTEFLWQEGHTVHATEEEAKEQTLQILDVYAAFARDYLAIPVIVGEKTPSERFPGASATYTIEAMMQDGKALQMGTSHFLGQNFAKGSGIEFRDANGDMLYAWTTSWGVTTRMIGALVMTHSDDDGLIVPPKIAATHAVIIPIIHKEEHREEILSYARNLASSLNELHYHGNNIHVHVDERDIRGGEKNWGWIKKGVPIRIEVGLREMESKKLSLFRRDQAHKEVTHLSAEEITLQLRDILDDIQANLYTRALYFRDSHITSIDSKEAFYAHFTAGDEEKNTGFVMAHWSGDPEVEKIVKELGVTIRCIPLEGEREESLCPITGRRSQGRVVYAKSY